MHETILQKLIARANFCGAQRTPLKTNMTLENPNFNRKYIFKWLYFHGHVSFRGCKFGKNHDFDDCCFVQFAVATLNETSYKVGPHNRLNGLTNG